MKLSIPSLFLILLVALPLTVAAAEPEVIYWNSDAGKVLRSRIAPDADYWHEDQWGQTPLIVLKLSLPLIRIGNEITVSSQALFVYGRDAPSGFVGRIGL